MLQIQITEDRPGTVLRLKCVGSVNEYFKPPEADLQKYPEVFVDLSGVEGINSVGIREWIRWTKSIPNPASLVYVGCPLVMVEQMNMIAGIAPAGARVKSFYLPYFCENCENESSRLIESATNALHAKDIQAPETIPCRGCGGEAKLDTKLSEYLTFLKGR